MTQSREVKRIPTALEPLKPKLKELWETGSIDLEEFLSQRRIAIVGTRNLDQRQTAAATVLAEQLAESGWAIVSGLALGTDQAAHRGCLRVGRPTAAVIASGFDRLAISARPLAKQIQANGLLLSEAKPDQRIERWRLVNRNRIIAGLSEAVIVFQSGCDGGTIYTVRDAWRLGRRVYSTSDSAAGRILLEEPARRLPELLKNFQLTIAERKLLGDRPLAQPLKDLNWLL